MVKLSSGLSTPEFRELLRRHREARRWSQQRLAGKSELDHSMVSRLERGERPPTRESLAKLCAGLDLADAEAEELWLVAGYLPPSLGTDELAAALALVRQSSAAEIAAAMGLIAAARGA
jgi:transcriptional regulator with XRE-family HTH domain